MDPKGIDPVVLTQDLIRCPSVTPEEGGALALLETTLEGLGFTVERVTFSDESTPDVENLYARLGTGHPNLCFAGHTDVVPVGDAAAWSAGPFAAEIRDGVLIGRGAADMKGAIASFVAAAADFAETRGQDFGGAISLLITGDEEGPSINGTRKLLQWIEDKGEKLDLCIVGEPTNPDEMGEMIKIGRRGSLNGWLTVRGVQGHSAYPQLADNPIHRLVKMLDTITGEAMDAGSEHFQPSSLQVTTVDVGNPATNVTPAEARARFNVRFNDLHSSQDVIAWVRARLDAVGGDYDLEVAVTGESFLCPPNAIAETLADAVEEVTGRRPELGTTGGTSDARFIKDHCPVCEFGLISQTMHKVDERTALADLRSLTAIYRALLERIFPV
ncbi:MAG: succinyl-diaminopimelate desuccinylase [Rhodovibrionaceae bacterium]